MSSRRRYRAPEDAVFVRLMQQHALAGFSVEPMAPIEVRDRYLDSADGVLLRQGLLLRLRTHGDQTTATLRSLEVDEEVAQERVDVPAGAAYLPEGSVRAAVEERSGGAELDLLLSFRQYRTPRALFEGERLAGVISLDVVADQTDAQNPVVSNEVELELLDAGNEDDLRRVHAELLEIGFEPDPFTKFERGFFRRELREEGRLLLLPAERRFLEQMAESESAVERRRAEALLMAAAGDDDRTISRRVGLAPSRVRHWRDAFRIERVRVFDESAAEAVIEEEEPVPTFTVSELVGDSVRIERDQAQPADLEDAVERVFEHVGFGSSGGDAGPWRGEPVQPGEPPGPPPEEGLSPREGAAHGELPPEATGESASEEPDPFGAQPSPVGASETADEWLSIEEPPEPAPPPASPDLQGHEEVQAEAVSRLVERLPLDPELPIAEAGRRLLSAAADTLDQYAAEVGSDAPGEAIAACTDAVQRARLGAELAAEALVQQRARRVISDAELLGGVLDEVGALYRAAESIDLGELEDRAAEERLALAMARTVWTVERRRTAGTSGDDQGLTQRLGAFGLRVREDADSLQEVPPRLRLLKHVLASTLWRCYEAARVASEEAATRDGSARIAQALAALEHVLSVIDGEAAASAQYELARVRQDLEANRYQHDLQRRFESFAREWLVPGGAAGPASLEEQRHRVAAAAEASAVRFTASWERLLDHSFRTRLGHAAASL